MKKSNNISVIIFFLFTFIFILNCYSSNTKEKYVYDSKGKRDPFFKVSKSKDTGVKAQDTSLSPADKIKNKGIKITSIVWDPNNPAILISDDILEVGDTVKGVIIRAIEKDYVVFEVDGELVEVPLSG